MAARVRMRGVVRGLVLGTMGFWLAAANAAEFLPQVMLSGAFKRFDYKGGDASQLSIGSTFRPTLRPSLAWGSEGKDPFKFSINTKFEGGTYSLGADRLVQDGGYILSGGGLGVSQEWGRFRAGIGGDFEQEKILGRDTNRTNFLSNVWLGSGYADLSFVAIGTSTKTLRLGFVGTYFFPSTWSTHATRLEDGFGGGVYWSYETGEAFGVGLQSGYTVRSFTSNPGTMTISEFYIGLKLFVPHQDLTKLPIDY